MATPQTQIKLSGLANRLITDQLLSSNDTEQAYQTALKQRVPFVQYLVANGVLDARRIALAAAQEFGVPLLDMDAIDLTEAPTSVVVEKLARKHHALPLFKRGNRLFLAVSDPTNHQGLDEIRFNTGMATEAVLVEEDKLSSAIEHMQDAEDAGGGLEVVE